MLAGSSAIRTCEPSPVAPIIYLLSAYPFEITRSSIVTASAWLVAKLAAAASEIATFAIGLLLAKRGPPK